MQERALGASCYIPAIALGKEPASSLCLASLLSCGGCCRCGCWWGLLLELSRILVLLRCVGLPLLCISPLLRCIALPLLLVCSAFLSLPF